MWDKNIRKKELVFSFLAYYTRHVSEIEKPAVQSTRLALFKFHRKKTVDVFGGVGGIIDMKFRGQIKVFDEIHELL